MLFHLYRSNIFVGILCKGFNDKRPINTPYESSRRLHYFPDVLKINIYAEGIFKVYFLSNRVSDTFKISIQSPQVMV